MREVFIVGAARTPIGDFMGSLKSASAVELADIATQKALANCALDPARVEEVSCGMIYKNGNKGNPARQIQLKCGMPETGWAYTVEQQCASGMKAVELAAQSIMLGKTDVAVAVGTESMSQAPYLLKSARGGLRLGHAEIYDSILYDGLECAVQGCHMGLTAETLAEEYSIGRREQDELAVLSHKRALDATLDGRFRPEIAPVTISTGSNSTIIDKDEHPRPDATLEKLATLRPAFKPGGTVTAGNASSISDGAAAFVLMSDSACRNYSVKPLAQLKAIASAGVEPRVMGIGPVYAIAKALKIAGLRQDEVDYFEINEAFAAQFLAVNRELKIGMDRVNANGSGIGLGHPVGCTGARILVTLIYEMRRRRARYGVASPCVGGGPAMATVVELLQ